MLPRVGGYVAARGSGAVFRVVLSLLYAAGLGGGSSDAATALRLANRTLHRPRSAEQLEELGRGLGADVPFFLRNGPQLGRGQQLEDHARTMSAEVSPLNLYERAEKAARMIRARAKADVSVAVVLGSGLGAFADELERERFAAADVRRDAAEGARGDRGAGRVGAGHEQKA